MMNTCKACPVCGCSEVIKESGFFFCIECQAQREGMCEQLFEKENDDDDDDRELDNSFRAHRSENQGRRKKTKTLQKKSEKLTSWEYYNYLLRGQVNELITLGAPKSIRNTVFQLWTYYLHKLEVAFASEDETALPKLSHHFKKGDAKLIYGLKTTRKEKKRKQAISNFDLSTSLSNLNDWSSAKMKKRLKLQMKKAFIKKVSEMSVMSVLGSQLSVLDDTQDIDNELNMDDTQDIDDSGHKVTISNLTKSHFNKYSLDFLESRHKENTGDKFKFWESNNYMNPCYLTKMKLLLFLHLALLHTRSEIQISDLLRWIREKHLSYHDVTHFLPENFNVQVCQILNVTSIVPYGEILRMSSVMTRFLGMVNWPVPDFSKLAQKYVQELQLPTMFCDLILRIIQMDPNIFCSQNELSCLPNYEGRVLAALIIILKVLFGLDGKTEHKISKVASKWNRWLSEKKKRKGRKLFVWKDWVRQIICRDAVLTNHYFPIKHVVCPEMFGNANSFIRFWNKTSSKRDKGKGNYQPENALLKDTQPALMSYFSHVLEKLQDASETDGDISFSPSLTPYSVYTQNILRKSMKSNSYLNSDARDILLEDFTICDINFLLDPSLMDKLAKKNDSCVTVTSKCTQKKFSTYLCKKSRCIDFSNKKSNAAITHCSAKQGKKLKRYNVEESFQFRLTRPEADFSIRKLLDEARQSIMNPTRKRKKSPAMKSSKRKRKNRRKNKSNVLKLYLPHSHYWILHDENCGSTNFDSLLVKFPFSFSWLLTECARVSEMSDFVLYKEVMYLEKAFKKSFVSS